MRTRLSFIAGGFLIILANGCANNLELQRLDALKRDADWPKIHAAAEMEIARKEGNTNWSYSAYYEPKQHTNGVWVVVASGAYPFNRMGDSIDLLIRDNGEVTSVLTTLSEASTMTAGARIPMEIYLGIFPGAT